MTTKLILAIKDFLDDLENIDSGISKKFSYNNVELYNQLKNISISDPKTWNFGNLNISDLYESQHQETKNHIKDHIQSLIQQVKNLKPSEIENFEINLAESINSESTCKINSLNKSLQMMNLNQTSINEIKSMFLILKSLIPQSNKNEFSDLLFKIIDNLDVFLEFINNNAENIKFIYKKYDIENMKQEDLLVNMEDIIHNICSDKVFISILSQLLFIILKL